MVTCPQCDANIDVDEDELDEGDVLSCDECGASLRVAGLNPLDIESDDDDDDDDDDDEFYEDEDEDGEDEDEEDGEEDW